MRVRHLPTTPPSLPPPRLPAGNAPTGTRRPRSLPPRALSPHPDGRITSIPPTLPGGSSSAASRGSSPWRTGPQRRAGSGRGRERPARKEPGRQHRPIPARRDSNCVRSRLPPALYNRRACLHPGTPASPLANGCGRGRVALPQRQPMVGRGGAGLSMRSAGEAPPLFKETGARCRRGGVTVTARESGGGGGLSPGRRRPTPSAGLLRLWWPRPDPAAPANARALPGVPQSCCPARPTPRPGSLPLSAVVSGGRRRGPPMSRPGDALPRRRCCLGWRGAPPAEERTARHQGGLSCVPAADGRGSRFTSPP